MNLVKAGYEILTPIDGMAILKHLEMIARVCYKSEDKITDESCLKFIGMLINRGHEAMIEHFNLSIKFICDRGVSHEIVRHRVASFGQESTRYCNYSKEKFGGEITFVMPCWFSENAKSLANHYCIHEDGTYALTYNWITKDETIWLKQMLSAEKAYKELLAGDYEEHQAPVRKWTPQEARSVLPNSLKTEIVMTANMREWRHFFKLRTAEAAHSQMREITIPLLLELKKLMPVIFDDINL